MTIEQGKQVVTQEYSGFQLQLENGDRSKKTMCNKLKISVPTVVSDVSINLNLRQAKALKKFLNENLD